MHPHIAFVGGGHMASALIRGLLRDGWPATQISVVDPDPAAAQRLAPLGLPAVQASLDALATAPDGVVWAIKPQVMRKVAESAAGCWPETLHLSVAAAIRTDQLCAWLRTPRVVRAMPNTPALVGFGITALFAPPALNAVDRALATQLLDAVGTTLWVDDESHMDAITATSGSGPAYVFRFLEAMQSGAESLGFAPALARQLVLRTALGAVQQALADDRALDELRSNVTSPGGTTEAALRVMANSDLDACMAQAMQSARNRAHEMAEAFGGSTP